MTPSGANRHAHVAQGPFLYPKDAMRHNRDISGWLVGCFGLNGPLRQYFSLYRAVSQREGVGCFGLNGPLRQYFSLYRAVSQREGERKEN